jgi:hypothetical protein
MRIVRTGALTAALLALAAMAGCGGGDEEGGAAPTVRPGPDNKTFGDPLATVQITEYFDYR